METILFLFITSFLLQLVGFIIAFTFKTDKFTDLFYGLGFAAISTYFIINNFSITGLVLTLMIWIWGIRLSGYLLIRINKMKKDSRFDEMRNDFFKFGGFWLLQSLSISIIISPAIIFITSKISSFSILNFVGLTIWLIGFIIEAISDIQKYKFINNPENKGKWVSTGLWKLSRHPNYFGESLLWFGVFIYSIPSLSGLYWLSIISPIFITCLLLFVSGIPILEKNMDKKFGKMKGYNEYKKNTPVFIPKLF